MLHLASKQHALRMLAPKQRPPYEEVWHLWSLIVPRRSITGRLLWGTVLRRRDDGRWIYKEYIQGAYQAEYPSPVKTFAGESNKKSASQRFVSRESL